ncbi:MAG: zinc finger domain-containing protein [Burkholderiales bacterium]
MRKPSAKPIERKCPACHGTGFPKVKQPVKPGSRIYPIKCKNCGGKGRIAARGAASRL